MKLVSDDNQAQYEIARMVPCRRCKQPVALYTWTALLAETFAAVLQERGEKPLEDTEIVLCDPCSVERRKVNAHKVIELMEHAVKTLARIRAGWVPDELCRQGLIKHGYQDAFNAALARQGKLTGRREDEP